MITLSDTDIRVQTDMSAPQDLPYPHEIQPPLSTAKRAVASVLGLGLWGVLAVYALFFADLGYRYDHEYVITDDRETIAAECPQAVYTSEEMAFMDQIYDLPEIQDKLFTEEAEEFEMLDALEYMPGYPWDSPYMGSYYISNEDGSYYSMVSADTLPSYEDGNGHRLQIYLNEERTSYVTSYGNSSLKKYIKTTMVEDENGRVLYRYEDTEDGIRKYGSRRGLIGLLTGDQ